MKIINEKKPIQESKKVSIGSLIDGFDEEDLEDSGLSEKELELMKKNINIFPVELEDSADTIPHYTYYRLITFDDDIYFCSSNDKSLLNNLV